MNLNTGDVLYLSAISKTNRSCHAIEEGIVKMAMGHPWGARIEAINTGATNICINDSKGNEIYRKKFVVT